MGFLSGLDWSGDAGDPARSPGGNPWLVFVVAHIEEADAARLVADIAALRARLGRSSRQPFKHQQSPPAAQAAFFGMLRTLPFQAHGLVVDKRLLGPPKGKDWGKQRIADGVVELVMKCPQRFLARQVLLIDLPRSDQTAVTRLSTSIRRAQRLANRDTIGKIRPCPDDGADGEIVQVADMIAGELREHGGMGGPHLRLVQGKVRVV